MTKILCILPICCFPTNNNRNESDERIQQYISGLNKFFDYMSHGKPIFSSISGVAGKLISDNNIGREYTNKDIDSLADLLNEVLADDNLITEMSSNSRQLFLENFSSERIYHNLVNHLVMVHYAL
jgi:glycosyltransferase involved in cell wall biosynthesis